MPEIKISHVEDGAGNVAHSRITMMHRVTDDLLVPIVVVIGGLIHAPFLAEVLSAMLSGLLQDGQHDPIAAAQSFAQGVNSHGDHFAPSPEAAATARAIAGQQAAAQVQPSAEPAPTPEDTGPIMLDKNGIPWDARIHSDAKERMSKSNEWKKKRGANDHTIATVEAELRAAVAANPGAYVQFGASPLPNGGVLGGIQTDNGAAPAPVQTEQPPVQTEQPPALTPPPVMAPPVVGDPATDFGAFMAYLAERSNVLGVEQIAAIARNCGMTAPDGTPSLQMLESTPERIGLAKQWVDHFVAQAQAQA